MTVRTILIPLHILVIGCHFTYSTSTLFFSYKYNAGFTIAFRDFLKYTVNILISFVEIFYYFPNLSTCAQWNSNGTRLTEQLALNFNMKELVDLSTGDNYFIDEYIDSNSVIKRLAGTFNFEIVTQFPQFCTTIFIDINDMMYCSIYQHHYIAVKSLCNNSDMITIAAGTGIKGSKAHMLAHPRGIFVNIDLDLYVADCNNHRVQLFLPGKFEGKTVAGTLGTIILDYPSSIVLDVHNYMYIVDTGNNRIVAGTPDGFRCILACTTNDALFHHDFFSSTRMAFDGLGNIYINDTKFMYIQKFRLVQDKCSKFHIDLIILTHSLSF